MRLERLRLADIKPYENNPRKNDGGVDAVIESIKQCSYIAPIIVDEDYVILAGHTRFKALEKLKYAEVDCIVCDNFSEEQKKKYRYLDNKTGEKATWDLHKLEEELENLDLGDFDFFRMSSDLGEQVDKTPNFNTSTEYDTEAFGDDEFRYECPSCGFRFN